MWHSTGVNSQTNSILCYGFWCTEICFSASILLKRCCCLNVKQNWYHTTPALFCPKDFQRVRGWISLTMLKVSSPQYNTDSDCCLCCLSVLQFNFVGKLLGPRGNSLKRLQEDTLTKMSILGKGSMRDKEKVKNALFASFSSLLFLLISPSCCTTRRCTCPAKGGRIWDHYATKYVWVTGNELVSHDNRPTGVAAALFIQANNKTGLKWE